MRIRQMKKENEIELKESFYMVWLKLSLRRYHISTFVWGQTRETKEKANLSVPEP